MLLSHAHALQMSRLGILLEYASTIDDPRDVRHFALDLVRSAKDKTSIKLRRKVAG